MTTSTNNTAQHSLGVLNSKYVVDFQIETLEPLAIGASQGSVQVGDMDRQIVKTTSGLPYIPGSGLKGYFRTYFDRVSPHLDKLNAHRFNLTHVIKDSKSNNTEVCDITQKKFQDLDLEEKFRNLCDLCLLFGAMGYGSPLSFIDAYPAEDDEIPLENRTHIRMDRGSDTTVKGGLFFSEAVPRGVTFQGQIIFEVRDLGDLEKEKRQLLLFGFLLSLLNQDHHLGGMKSRGYGLVKFHCTGLQKYNFKDLIMGNRPSKSYEEAEIPSFIQEVFA